MFAVSRGRLPSSPHCKEKKRFVHQLSIFGLVSRPLRVKRGSGDETSDVISHLDWKLMSRMKTKIRTPLMMNYNYCCSDFVSSSSSSLCPSWGPRSLIESLNPTTSCCDLFATSLFHETFVLVSYVDFCFCSERTTRNWKMRDLVAFPSSFSYFHVIWSREKKRNAMVLTFCRHSHVIFLKSCLKQE